MGVPWLVAFARMHECGLARTSVLSQLVRGDGTGSHLPHVLLIPLLVLLLIVHVCLGGLLTTVHKPARSKDRHTAPRAGHAPRQA